MFGQYRVPGGRPTILASQVGAPILFVDPFDMADPDGLPYTGTRQSATANSHYSYQWIRVGDDNTETDIGTDSPSYHLVDDDIGKLIIVQISYEDDAGNPEVVTSEPYGPVRRRPVDSSLTPSTRGQQHGPGGHRHLGGGDHPAVRRGVHAGQPRPGL